MGNLRIQRGRGYNPQQRNIEPQDTSANPIQTTAGVAELIAQIGSMNKDIQNQKILMLQQRSTK